MSTTQQQKEPDMMNKTQYVMKLHIADKRQNELMEAVDLKPKYKVFVTDAYKAKFTLKDGAVLSPEFFLNIIEKSKEGAEQWIPMIKFNDSVYVSPEIREVSDGNNTLFVGKQ